MRKSSGTTGPSAPRAAALVTAAAGALLLAAGASPALAASAGPSAPVPALRTAAQDGEGQANLVSGEDARLIAVRVQLARTPTGADGLQQPFRIPTGGSYTLVLTARKSPYTLADLIRLEPQTLVQLPDKAYLLQENLVVAQGATLALGGGGRLTLRLMSQPRGFTSIVSLGGRLQFQGSPAAPVEVTSWDSSTAADDVNLSDGRAYIRAVGGTLFADHLLASDLGFWSGRTGGVALTGSNRPQTGAIGSDPHGARQRARAARTARKAAVAGKKAGAATAAPAHASGTAAPAGSAASTPAAEQVNPVAPVTASAVTGEITGSTLTGNAFGLFVSDAQGVRVRDSTVQRSVADGVVLHHFVTGATLERVTSQDNAGSGFNLSRGVEGAVLTNDTASRNRGDGFRISGQPLASGLSAAGQSSTSYGSNELLASVATDNAQAGVQILSGHTETVQTSRFSGNAEGVVVSGSATGTLVSGNTVSRSRSNGITVRGGAQADVSANSVDGSRNGIAVRDARATIHDNVVTDASLHGISFVGTDDRSSASNNVLSGRGTTPVDLSRASHRQRITVSGNRTGGWVSVHRNRPWWYRLLQPMTITLGVLTVIILLGSFGSRRRRRSVVDALSPYASTRPLWSSEDGGGAWPTHSPLIDLRDDRPGELAANGNHALATP